MTLTRSLPTRRLLVCTLAASVAFGVFGLPAFAEKAAEKPSKSATAPKQDKKASEAKNTKATGTKAKDTKAKDAKAKEIKAKDTKSAKPAASKPAKPAETKAAK